MSEFGKCHEKASNKMLWGFKGQSSMEETAFEMNLERWM